MLEVATHISSTIFEGLQIQQLWHASQQLGFPSALWRLPHTSEIKLLVSLREDIRKCQPELEKLSPGFIISNFHWQQGDDISFLEGDIILSFNAEMQLNSVHNSVSEEHPEIQRLVKLAASVMPENTSIKKDNPVATAGIHLYTDQKERFKRTVELAVTAIRQKQFKKVVLSRTKDLPLSADFQPAKAFVELVKTYPHAFVSLVNLPAEQEIWLGASPELLAEQNTQGIFKTMSLAGTQKARTENGGLIPKYDVRWGEKEIEEQALVSRYIVECFKKIRLREYTENGPKTVLAGNLYHLRTDFEVDTVSLHFPELSSVMLGLLHPTSAVCGTPKESSLRFLTEVEGYDRSYYSGFLGPAQIGEKTSLYVNLRNVRFKDGRATFFAGAGITEDSVPEQEWDETELKCDTLLKVIAKTL